MALFVLTRAFFISSLLVGALPVARSAPIPSVDDDTFGQVIPQAFVREVSIQERVMNLAVNSVVVPALNLGLVHEAPDSSDLIESLAVEIVPSENDGTATTGAPQKRQCRHYCMFEIPGDDSDASSAIPTQTTPPPAASEPTVSPTPEVDEPTETESPLAEEIASLESDLLSLTSELTSAVETGPGSTSESETFVTTPSDTSGSSEVDLRDPECTGLACAMIDVAISSNPEENSESFE